MVASAGPALVGTRLIDGFCKDNYLPTVLFDKARIMEWRLFLLRISCEKGHFCDNQILSKSRSNLVVASSELVKIDPGPT